MDVLELGARQQQQELESAVSTQDTVLRSCPTRGRSHLEMEAATGGHRWCWFKVSVPSYTSHKRQCSSVPRRKIVAASAAVVLVVLEPGRLLGFQP